MFNIKMPNIIYLDHMIKLNICRVKVKLLRDLQIKNVNHLLSSINENNLENY